MAMWSDAVSPKIKQMAQAMVEGTEPTGEAQDLPDEVHIEQMRQWGFTVIPGVIPSDRLPACVCHLCLHCCVFFLRTAYCAAARRVRAEVEAFQARNSEYYETVTGMTKAMREAMLARMAAMRERGPQERGADAERARTYRRGALERPPTAQAAAAPSPSDVGAGG